MGTLRIRYIPERLLAEMKFDGEESIWSDLQRFFNERCREVNNIASDTLTVPWWSFLTCRENLIFVLERHNIDLEIDEASRLLLEGANERNDLYESAINTNPLEAEQMLRNLSEAGFRRDIRDLTPEQTRNVSRLCVLPSGATFSVPGAGKTTEAIAFFLLKKTPNTKLIVVAPKNAFAAWEEQFGICVPSRFRIVRLNGGLNNIQEVLQTVPDIMLITYQQLPNVQGIIAQFMMEHPTFMFLDESHRIKKGQEGIWGSAVLQMSHLAGCKLVMSGTPLPNSINDLIPQFNFLYPEVESSSNTITAQIGPVYVRTTKEELQLPPITRVNVPVDMTPDQRHLYELLRSEEARQAEGLLVARDRNSLRRIGRSVIRLLQLTSNPSLLAQNDFNLPDHLCEVLMHEESPKITYVCRRVRELARRGMKSIIWSNFVENVELLANRLSDLGADFIHGGVEAGDEYEEETRENKIRNFHENPNAFVLVANPAACAEGISLHTVCHHAIYLDRNYNAAQYLQSEDRIYRLGLAPDTNTLVEIVYCPDSIDESVNRRLIAKVSRMATVLQDRSLTINPITLNDENLDEDGIDEVDIRDIIAHLRGMQGG